MCILRILPENTPDKIGQERAGTEVLLTADNLQQYVKKIEVDHKKNTYTEFVF